MKKIFTLLLVFTFTLGLFSKVDAMGFIEAYNKSSSKPAAILIYADWAGNLSSYNANFKKAQAKYKDKYNFVTLNIADSEARVFNSKYYFFTVIPYIFLIRNGGKVTKQIPRDCLQSASCIADKMSTFLK